MESFEPGEIDDESTEFIALDKTMFIQQRLSYQQHKLVSFFIGLFAVDGEVNKELYSVDTHHGWLHAHIYGHQSPQDRRDVRQLFSQQDVEESFEEAYDMVLAVFEARAER